MVTTTALKALQGKIVLVKSTRDRRNPPTAMRGWFEVHDGATGEAPTVSIAVEFPQMFSIPAHHRIIPIDPGALETVLASEHDGVFEFTIDDELE